MRARSHNVGVLALMLLALGLTSSTAQPVPSGGGYVPGGTGGGGQVPRAVTVAISSNVHDFACGRTCLGVTEVRLDCQAGPGLCGISGLIGFANGSAVAVPGGSEGAEVTIVNISSVYDVMLFPNLGDSEAATRFALPEPFLLKPNAAKTFKYDTISRRLRPTDDTNGVLQPWALLFNTQLEPTTGGFNDYVVNPGNSIIEFTGSASVTLKGIVAGYPGQQLTVICAVSVSSPCTISNLATGQSPGDQILAANGGDACISANGNGAAELSYDPTARSNVGAWRVLGEDTACHNPTQTFNGGITTKGSSTLGGTTTTITSATLIEAELALGSAVSVTWTGAPVNNFTTAGLGAATILKATVTADTTLSGVTAPTNVGHLLDVRNDASSTGAIIIPSLSGLSSTANQIGWPLGFTEKVPPGASLIVYWNGTNWRGFAEFTYEFPQLIVDGVGSINGSLDMLTHQIHDVVDPTSAQDAATKAYVDAHAGSGSGGGTVTSVVCGSGLTGGTITASGTCAFDSTYLPTFAGADTHSGVTTLGDLVVTQQADTGTGTIAEFALGATTTTVVWKGASAATWRGASGCSTLGRRFTVINASEGQTLTFDNEDASATSATDRFRNVGAQADTLVSESSGVSSIEYECISATAGNRWAERGKSTRQTSGTTTAAGLTVNTSSGITTNTGARYKDSTTAAALSANCTSGTGSSITTGESHFTVTVGSTATACTITPNTAFTSSTPTCAESSRTAGEASTGMTYTGSPVTAITLSTVVGGHTYDVDCTDH